MLPFIAHLLDRVNPYLQPMYFVVAWVFFGILVSTLIIGLRDIKKRGQIMHQIPCSRCQYFTNNHRLKCTLQPLIANTELAIDCGDFALKKS